MYKNHQPSPTNPKFPAAPLYKVAGSWMWMPPAWALPKYTPNASTPPLQIVLLPRGFIFFSGCKVMDGLSDLSLGRRGRVPLVQCGLFYKWNKLLSFQKKKNNNKVMDGFTLVGVFLEGTTLTCYNRKSDTKKKNPCHTAPQ
jgi:hypothetical protein